jgi:hypothetical protein
MLLLIMVVVLTYWGCESSNNSETSRSTEGNGSGLRLAINMPAGTDPAIMERFEISVTGPGISLFESVVREIAIGARPLSVALDDIDGNGRLDIVTANARSDDVSILFGNEDGSFEEVHAFPVADEPRSVALGDIDGDGRLDIVTANALSADTVSILFGIGNRRFSNAQFFSVG